MTSKLWRSFVYIALLSTLSLFLGQVGYAQSITPPTLDSEEWAFLTLINNYRAHNGAGPLQVSVTLENSSHWMANDMATHNATSHTDSLGRDPQTRMTSFGYPYYPWGENIAGGYADSASVFNAWVNSEDHRVNMVNPAFAVIGIGRSYSSSSRYGWYWATDFGGVVDQTITPSSGPAITSFTATPSAITAAQPVTLSWAVSGASAVSIDNGIGDVSGTTSKAVSPTTTTTYTLTATSTGGTSVARVTATVNTVLAGQINLPANTAIQPGQQANFPVTLANPAPPGGVFIALTSSDPSTVTVAPANIFIPQGASAPSRSPIVNGINVGSAIVTASSSGLASATGLVQVGTGGTMIPINLPANTTVGLGLSVPLPVTLGTPAPAGGVNILLASGDPSKVIVTPSVFIAGGAMSPATQATVNGISAGLVNISASAPGYTPGSGQVQVITTSGGSSFFSPASLAIAAGTTGNLTLSLSGPAPANLTASLSSNNTSAATVLGSVTFAAGATSVNVPVTGVGTGAAGITAITPGFGNATASAIVSSSASSGIILPANTAIQPGQQANFPVTLANPAPPGGVFIALTSSDPSTVTVAPANIFIPQGASAPSRSPIVNGINVGSAIVTASSSGLASATGLVQVGTGGTMIPINLPANTTVGLGLSVPLPVTLGTPAPAGGVNILLASGDPSKVIVTPSVFIAGGAMSPATQATVNGISAGLVNISASAPGYSPGSGQVQVITTSGGSSFFSPASLAINTGSTGNLTLSLSGPAPAGLTASLSSNNTSAATVLGSVTFAAGATSVNVPVTGVGTGAAGITAITPGFGNATASVIVSSSASSGIILPANTAIQPGQQANFPVTLANPAPPGGVFIALTSSDPSTVTVAPANIFIPQGASAPSRSPIVNGINAGSATITASASSLAPATGLVQVGTGGVPTSPVNLPTNTTVGLGLSVALPVTLGASAPAGGVNILLASSDPSKVIVTPSVFIAGGAMSPATQATVNGISAGLVNISASAPGYTPGSGQVQVITTSVGSSFFSPASLAIATGTTGNLTLSLSGPAPAGLTASLSSNNTGAATVLGSVTFTVGATSVNVPVTGVGAAGTATITAITPGFGNATANVIVSSSAISVTWYGACWQPATFYEITGNFQAIDYVMTTPAPVTIQGSLFFSENCDPRQGIDNMNDFGTLTGSGHRVIGFTHYPDVIPSSAMYWMGPRTADGMCAPGSPCSGCVNYTRITPDCSTLP